MHSQHWAIQYLASNPADSVLKKLLQSVVGRYSTCSKKLAMHPNFLSGTRHHNPFLVFRATPNVLCMMHIADGNFLDWPLDCHHDMMAVLSTMLSFVINLVTAIVSTIMTNTIASRIYNHDAPS